MNIASYYHTNGDLQIGTLLIIFFITLVVYCALNRFLKDPRPKYLLATLFTGIFFYSGFGIAYDDISDKYIYHYTIFLISFGLPFLLCQGITPYQKMSSLDRAFIKSPKALRLFAYFYLLLRLIPLLFPEFRLLDLFTFKTASYHELTAISKGSAVVNIADTLSVLVAPFFYASFTIEQMINPRTKKPLLLFIILIILQYGRYNYFARYQIVTYIEEMILLLFCVKGLQYRIKMKYVLSIVVIVLLLIPFLYLYTIFRIGESYSGSRSFLTMLDLLTKGEFYYPAFYEDILKHLDFLNESLENFIEYILCLPIPSAIWPDKPSYDVNAAFTYMFTGLSRGEDGFYILLPSIMGEAFINGGEMWFWVFSLISGLVIALIFRYICKNKTMILYVFIIIVTSFSYGRGGSTLLLPTLINGTLSIFIFDLYSRRKH